jgi:hypothetical protein
MGEPRIVKTFAVGDEGPEDRTDLQQLIPIAIVAGQAGGIVTEDQASASQTNLGEQILEAATRKGVGCGFAQILINDFHPLYFAIPI